MRRSAGNRADSSAARSTATTGGACGAARRSIWNAITWYPLDQGGPHTLDNVLMLCADCHIDAHRTIDPERAAWRRLLETETP